MVIIYFCFVSLQQKSSVLACSSLSTTTICQSDSNHNLSIQAIQPYHAITTINYLSISSKFFNHYSHQQSPPSPQSKKANFLMFSGLPFMASHRRVKTVLVEFAASQRSHTICGSAHGSEVVTELVIFSAEHFSGFLSRRTL